MGVAQAFRRLRERFGDVIGDPPPRRLEPVTCSVCDEMPFVWSTASSAERWHVRCWQCYPMLIGSDVWDDNRNDAVRMWNNVHGDVVLDGEEVARFRRREAKKGTVKW